MPEVVPVIPSTPVQPSLPPPTWDPNIVPAWPTTPGPLPHNFGGINPFIKRQGSFIQVTLIPVFTGVSVVKKS